MKNLMKLTVALMVMGLGTVNAGEHHDHDHSGHSHKHNEAHKHGPRKEGDSNLIIQMKETIKTIEINAKKKIQTLVLKKKIPESWAAVAVQKAEKTTNGTDDWAVSFNNTKIEDKLKQTLYVFVSAYGKVVGVNYTGK